MISSDLCAIFLRKTKSATLKFPVLLTDKSQNHIENDRISKTQYKDRQA